MKNCARMFAILASISVLGAASLQQVEAKQVPHPVAPARTPHADLHTQVGPDVVNYCKDLADDYKELVPRDNTYTFAANIMMVVAPTCAGLNANGIDTITFLRRLINPNRDGAHDSGSNAVGDALHDAIHSAISGKKSVVMGVGQNLGSIPNYLNFGLLVEPSGAATVTIRRCSAQNAGYTTLYSASISPSGKSSLLSETQQRELFKKLGIDGQKQPFLSLPRAIRMD